jgi:hypothetical protein
MPELPAPRCATCKMVLSPHWRACQVCNTPIGTAQHPAHAPALESVLKSGDRIVYRDEGTKHLKEGRVQRVVVQHHHLSIMLESGATILGRQICSMSTTNQEGAITAARTVREEDLLMTPPPPPVTAGPAASAAPAPRSAWYQHWKDIATMTHSILPHEPRLKTILTMIDRCTAAFENNDEPAFLRAKEQLSNFVIASTPRTKPAPASPPPPAAQSA